MNAMSQPVNTMSIFVTFTNFRRSGGGDKNKISQCNSTYLSLNCSEEHCKWHCINGRILHVPASTIVPFYRGGGGDTPSNWSGGTPPTRGDLATSQPASQSGRACVLRTLDGGRRVLHHEQDVDGVAGAAVAAAHDAEAQRASGAARQLDAARVAQTPGTCRHGAQSVRRRHTVPGSCLQAVTAHTTDPTAHGSTLYRSASAALATG